MFPDGFRWEDALNETAVPTGAALRRGTTFADTDSAGEYNAALALLRPANTDPTSFRLRERKGHVRFSLDSGAGPLRLGSD